MKIFRHLLLILFFAGLVSLEIWHGFFRLETLTRKQRDEALEAIRSGQATLVRIFNENLRAERDHARYLRNLPGVRELLQAPESTEENLRARLGKILIPYHHTFQYIIDRITLYDIMGRERFKSIRQGGGVGSLSRELLGHAEGRLAGDIATLVTSGSIKVMLSELEIESERVDVPESDRQVLRFAALVTEKEKTLGVLVLTLYAAPFLDFIRSWEPRPGVVSTLIDSKGDFLAHPDRKREQPDTPGLTDDYPSAAAAILRGEGQARHGDALLVSRPVAEGLPGWQLMAAIPNAAIEATAIPIRGEYLWVIGSMGGTALILVLAGAFFLRLSIREVRLAEEGRYLERIRRESARYRALMEGAADMIIIVAPERETIREANAIARTTLGLPGGECPLDSVLPAAHRKVFRECLRAAAAGTATDLPEIWLHGPDGKEIPASGRLAAIDLGDERVVEVALRDLTRQKEMERQLRISERLGSLGLLTAGVAHEINNPLEGIENYLALLDREGIDTPRKSRYLEMIRYGFRRIRNIVRDLSSFARPEVKGSTADLNEVIERALGMVRYDRVFRTTEVERVGLDRPLVVLGDPGRLEQVFINLSLNAARAMQGGGRITITARRLDPRTEVPEPMVEVRVEDNGPGIPEETLGRIFDPFFTTSEGTGLGLSISYGIIRAHGGDIRAENRPEGGARFVLQLPAAPVTDASAGAKPVEGTSDQMLTGRSGK